MSGGSLRRRFFRYLTNLLGGCLLVAGLSACGSEESSPPGITIPIIPDAVVDFGAQPLSPLEITFSTELLDSSTLKSEFTAKLSNDLDAAGRQWSQVLDAKAFFIQFGSGQSAQLLPMNRTKLTSSANATTSEDAYYLNYKFGTYTTSAMAKLFHQSLAFADSEFHLYATSGPVTSPYGLIDRSSSSSLTSLSPLINCSKNGMAAIGQVVWLGNSRGTLSLRLGMHNEVARSLTDKGSWTVDSDAFGTLFSSTERAEARRTGSVITKSLPITLEREILSSVDFTSSSVRTMPVKFRVTYRQNLDVSYNGACGL